MNMDLPGMQIWHLEINGNINTHLIVVECIVVLFLVSKYSIEIVGT